MKRSTFLVLGTVFLFAAACGGGGGGGGDAGIPGPTGLSATGELNSISLSWDASSIANLTGYNVYRSPDGAIFSLRNGSTVAGTAYADTVSSPEGDGVFYRYMVTALGDEETDPSSVIQAMHGTRVASSYDSGFATQAQYSPYVLEGTTIVDGAGFTIVSGTKLYMLDNALVDLEDANIFNVQGLLRVEASTSQYAAIMSHATGGGVLSDGDGIRLWFVGADDFNSGDGSGTLLKNIMITGLRSGESIKFDGCSPMLYNLKVTSNVANGGCYFTFINSPAPIIRNCYFTKMVPKFDDDLRSSSASIDHNIFRGGYYSVFFASLANEAIDPGQVELNDFDGTKNAYLFNMSGTTNVPVGNNYFNGGVGTPPLPSVITGGTTNCAFDFSSPSAALSSAPSAGPDW